MKRFFTLLMTVAALTIILGACNTGTDVPTTQPTQAVAQTPVASPQPVIYTPVEPITPENALTPENLIQDLDYLAVILQENFPHLNHAYRQYGFDLTLQMSEAVSFI